MKIQFFWSVPKGHDHRRGKSSFTFTPTRKRDLKTFLFWVLQLSRKAKGNKPHFPSRIGECLLSLPLQICLQTALVQSHRSIRPTVIHHLLSWHYPTGRRHPRLHLEILSMKITNRLRDNGKPLVESNTHCELAFGRHYGRVCISLALLFRAIKSTGRKKLNMIIGPDFSLPSINLLEPGFSDMRNCQLWDVNIHLFPTKTWCSEGFF